MRARPVPLVAPPLLWLAHFVALYALASLACAPGEASPTVRAAVIFWGSALFTAVALALALAGIVRNRRRLRAGGPDEALSFIARTGSWLYGLAALAMLWVALPALLLPGCA
jgi:hypothetical protein